MSLNRQIWKWPLFLIIAAGYLWAKKYGVHYTASGDENAYFYMAKLMASGKLFYRDFFFAHPPLELALLSLIYLLFGFNFVLLKLTAVIPPLIAAAFIYHQFWRKNQPLAGGLFLVLFLFNYEFLKISSHPFGLSLTGAELMLSLYFFLDDRPFPAGIFWGLAGITGLYALPWGAVALAAYAFDRDRLRSWTRFLGGFFAVFLPVHGLFFAFLGDKYLTPVFLYHFLKPPGQEIVGDVIIRIIRRNLLLFFLPFLYFWAPKEARGNAVLAAGLLYLVFLIGLNPLFTQYFMLPIPYLTWTGAVGLSALIRSVNPRRWRLLATGVAVVGLAGITYDNIRRYLVHEAGTGFRTLSACCDFIVNNSDPSSLIFGQVTTAPLLAILTGRNLALDMVDTNPMRFLSGVTKVEDLIGALENEPKLAFVIVQEDRLWLDERVQEFLARRCRPAAIFEEPRGTIFLFDCRK